MIAGAPPEGLKAFAADRAPFTAGMTRQTPADATVALQTYLGWLEDQLADGRAFLLRRRSPASPTSRSRTACGSSTARRRCCGILAAVRAAARLVRTRDRAFGHGTPTTDEERARRSRWPRRPRATSRPAVEPGLGFEAGESVTVTPTDYGRDPVVGALVGLTRRRGGDRAPRRARRHAARALPAHRVPDSKGSEDMKTFKGRTAVITGAGSGFGLEAVAHRRARGHERRDGRRAAGRAGPRRRRDPRPRRAGAAASGSTCPRPPRSRRWARPRARASARRTSSSTTPASAPAG